MKLATAEIEKVVHKFIEDLDSDIQAPPGWEKANQNPYGNKYVFFKREQGKPKEPCSREKAWERFLFANMGKEFWLDMTNTGSREFKIVGCVLEIGTLISLDRKSEYLGIQLRQKGTDFTLVSNEGTPLQAHHIQHLFETPGAAFLKAKRIMGI